MARLEILSRRADFVAAARDGVKVGGALVGLQLRDRDEPDGAPRIGFTVTKRVGHAVERNRMKRRLRAAARETLDAAAKPGRDYVLLARRAVIDAPFGRLLQELRDAARRAHGREASLKTPNAATPERRPEHGR